MEIPGQTDVQDPKTERLPEGWETGVLSAGAGRAAGPSLCNPHFVGAQD